MREETMTFVFSDTADYKQYLVTEHPIKKSLCGWPGFHQLVLPNKKSLFGEMHGQVKNRSILQIFFPVMIQWLTR